MRYLPFAVCHVDTTGARTGYQVMSTHLTLAGARDKLSQSAARGLYVAEKTGADTYARVAASWNPEPLARVATRGDLAHFTLDGRALCSHSCVAYQDRLRAAGSPPCSDTIAKQTARFAPLAAQFPGRIALVHGGCPDSVAVES
jgi:hypothetical protein